MENLPRRRRDSVDNKARLDIDDIFCTLAMLDEKKLMDKLPTYVARNVENIPMLKMEEGEFRVLKHGIDSLANDVKKVNLELMSKFGALGESLCAQFESHVRSVIQTMNVELDRKLDSLLSSVSTIPFRSSVQVDHSVSGSQGNKQNITSEVVNRFIDNSRFIDNNASMDTSSIDTSDVENCHEIDNNSDFTEFQGRRKRRKKLVAKGISPSKHDVVTNTSKFEHITPILKKLHWLPIKQRIDYKLCLLTYKTLQIQQPTYLYNSLSFPSHSLSTRSSDSSVLSIPYVRTSLGKRAFSVIAPRLWNSLPPDTRNSLSVSTFRSKLKTHLFKLAFPLEFSPILSSDCLPGFDSCFFLYF